MVPGFSPDMPAWPGSSPWKLPPGREATPRVSTPPAMRGGRILCNCSVGQVRDPRPIGDVTVWADTPRHGYVVVGAVRKRRVRFNITVREFAWVRRLHRTEPENACPTIATTVRRRWRRG